MAAGSASILNLGSQSDCGDRLVVKGLRQGYPAVSRPWTAYRGGAIIEGFYTQVRYSQSRWETIAFCPSRAVANSIAAGAFEGLPNARGETPHQVRVVSADQLIQEGGEREISLATVDLAVILERDELLIDRAETRGRFRVHKARCPKCETVRTFVLRDPPGKTATAGETGEMAPAWTCRRCRTTVPEKDLDPPVPPQP